MADAIYIGQEIIFDRKRNGMECRIIDNLKVRLMTAINGIKVKPYERELIEVVWADGKKDFVSKWQLRKKQ